jgi:hypothetical protein
MEPERVESPSLTGYKVRTPTRDIAAVLLALQEALQTIPMPLTNMVSVLPAPRAHTFYQ